MNKFWTLPILGLALTSIQIIASRSADAATLFQANLNVEQEVCRDPSLPCPTITPPPTIATGLFRAKLNDAEDALSYTFEINGLDLGHLLGSPQTADTGDDVYKVHIHFAPPGVPGPVVFAPIDLTMPMPPANPLGSEDLDDLQIVPFQDKLGGTISGIWEQTDGPGGAIGTTLKAQLKNLKSGNLYANVHSLRFLVNGEIRGQIEQVPEPGMLIGLAVAGSIGLILRRHKQEQI